MAEIKFTETVIHGVNGRNGYSHFAGLSVHASGRQVVINPISPNGNNLNAHLNLFGSDGGRVARAIAEESAKASPESREEIAAQLRAALVTIESGADDKLDDDISSFAARAW